MDLERKGCVIPSSERGAIELGGSRSDLGLVQAKGGSDLLWVLPLLTCGSSPNAMSYALVREF